MLQRRPLLWREGFVQDREHAFSYGWTNTCKIIIGSECEWASHLFVQWKFVWPCVRLSDQMEHNGHAQRKKHVVDIMPLEQQTWIKEGEELGKEVNSVHVAILNVTETEKIVVGTWSQRIGKVIEHELEKEANSVHIGLKATKSEQERRQWQCARTRALERLRMRTRRA